MRFDSEPILVKQEDCTGDDDVVIPMLDNANSDYLVEEETVFDKNGHANKKMDQKQGVMESNLNSINLILIVVGVLSIAFMVS